MTAWTLLIVAALTGAGFFAGLVRARSLRLAGGPAFHSLPAYHGLMLAAGAISTSVFAAALAAIAVGSASVVMPARRHRLHCRHCRASLAHQDDGAKT
jgi:hypothetical protein